MSERGVVFRVNERHFPLTVEEAWTLREHLPESDGPLNPMRARLEQLVREADEIDAPSPAMTVFASEKAAVRLALDRWLHAVKADAFPPRAWALRDALFVEAVGALAFRDVVLRYDDGHEEHETDVLVTGDPFEHADRWWKPENWRSLHGIDEIDGELRTWLVCAERPAPHSVR